MKKLSSFFGLTLFLVLGVFTSFEQAYAAMTIEERMAQLVPYDLTDPRISTLTPNDKKVLYHLIKAGDVMNLVMLEQSHPRGRAWLEKLQALVKSDPSKKPYLDYYKATFSPFDPFNGEWFLPEGIASEKWAPLAGGNAFNTFINKEGIHVGSTGGEFSAALKFYTEKERKEIMSPFTVVRGFNGLSAFPYSEMYKDLLDKASSHLKEAARLTTDPTLKALCLSRMEAFKTNQFDELEGAWINSSKSPIQLVIGPYEEFDDVLGTKRGFQAQVALKDEKTSKELEVYFQFLEKFQKNLPFYEKYSEDKHKLPFMTAVNQIFLGGDSRRGALAMAEHLPNTREVGLKYGTRQLFFLNVLKGKCENILLPIAKIVMNEEQLKHVNCDSNTKFTIHHEIAHGLGPSFYKDAEGKNHELNDVLGRMAGPVEEAKADSVGLLDRQSLILGGSERNPNAEMEMYATYTANFFRSVRFGGASPHRRGILFQFNMLREKGAISFDPDGKVRFDRDKMRAHIKDVVAALIGFQLAGDPSAIEAALSPDHYGKISSEMAALLKQISETKIPRDLYPLFSGADQILAENKTAAPVAGTTVPVKSKAASSTAGVPVKATGQTKPAPAAKK